jgi:two-component system OmpR family response regulator/two-component system response regulator QseB
MRILVVEDDVLLGDALEAGLAQAGFAVDWMRDGVTATHAIETEPYAAVVLDLGLPRLSGLDVLRTLRGHGNKVPVLVLTARDAIDDRVRGLDAGADDYVVKPVDLAELAARLRALVRRAAGDAAPSLTLDPAAREVAFRGKSVTLQPREFAVLHELMRNAGRVLSREQLESRLYGFGDEPGSNAVEVYVHHLRRKLAPDLIRTIRGVGYLMPRAPHA